MGRRSGLLEVDILWLLGCIWVHNFVCLTFSFGIHSVLKRFCNWQILSLASRRVAQQLCLLLAPPLPLEFVVPGYLVMEWTRASSWILERVRAQHYVEVQSGTMVEPCASQTQLLFSQLHNGVVFPALLHVMCPSEQSILLNGETFTLYPIENNKATVWDKMQIFYWFFRYMIFTNAVSSHASSISKDVVACIYLASVSLEESEKSSAKALLGLFGFALL